jgi:hypothetical protein
MWPQKDCNDNGTLYPDDEQQQAAQGCLNAIGRMLKQKRQEGRKSAITVWTETARVKIVSD